MALCIRVRRALVFYEPKKVTLKEKAPVFHEQRSIHNQAVQLFLFVYSDSARPHFVLGKKCRDMGIEGVVDNKMFIMRGPTSQAITITDKRTE